AWVTRSCFAMSALRESATTQEAVPRNPYPATPRDHRIPRSVEHRLAVLVTNETVRLQPSLVDLAYPFVRHPVSAGAEETQHFVVFGSAVRDPAFIDQVGHVSPPLCAVSPCTSREATTDSCSGPADNRLPRTCSQRGRPDPSG